jgi:hypothetical protein
MGLSDIRAFTPVFAGYGETHLFRFTNRMPKILWHGKTMGFARKNSTHPYYGRDLQAQFRRFNFLNRLICLVVSSAHCRIARDGAPTTLLSALALLG